MSGDTLTERGYWDSAWDQSRGVEPWEPDSLAPAIMAFHGLFTRCFPPAWRSGRRLVELGCGASASLPYFTKHLGFAAEGVDYSPSGCAAAKAILHASGVEAAVHQADLFAPPAALLERFDVAVSFGVVEHFLDTARVIAACAAFLRPGGVLVTSVPNLTGLIGVIQRPLEHGIFKRHVPLDARLLASAHTKAGLQVIRAGHLLSCDLSVCNVGEDGPDAPPQWKRATMRGLRLGSGAWRRAERVLGPVGSSRFLSPYALCIARKKGI